jgi:hypothetical protein
VSKFPSIGTAPFPNSVREAPDGASALALFDADQFQIDPRLTDIVMPDIPDQPQAAFRTG